MSGGAPSTVRVMTWNIHGLVGRNPRFDLKRAIELINHWSPDIMALQEVDSRRPSLLGVDPFVELPRALGHHGVGAKSVVTADGHYGQMLISRWPIGTPEIRDISYGEREPRRAIKSDIDTPAGRLRVVAAHLGLSVGERRSQARTLLELVGDTAVTTVVAGDFNDWFWVGSVRAALSHVLPAKTLFRTFPSAFPLLRLDRIYCRPREALLACHTDARAHTLSDHLPVIADVALHLDRA